jgi:hypothetical protein
MAQYGRIRWSTRPVWLSLDTINSLMVLLGLEMRLFTDHAFSFEFHHYLLHELLNKTSDIKISLDETLKVFWFCE